MSSAAFFSLKKLRGSGIIVKAARHNKRVIQAELGASGSIDATRSSRNMTLIGSPDANDVAMFGKQKIVEAGITKTRKDAVIGIELIFSLPTGHCQNVIDYFTACAKWSGDEFGGVDNIISADYHADESQDHAHVILVPLLGGRLRGSDMVGNKKRLSDLQASFFKKVASRFGFAKPRHRMSGDTKTQVIRSVLEQMRQDQNPLARTSSWAVIRDFVERDPTPFALALGIAITDPSTKPTKTMAQIFTGKGKGAQTEKPTGFERRKGAQVENPIGFEERKAYRDSNIENEQTLPLCRVPSVKQGFRAKATRIDQHVTKATSITNTTNILTALDSRIISDVQPNEKHSCCLDDVVVIRDDDFSPNSYDPETGEFFTPAPLELSVKRKAREWVEQELANRR